MNSTSGSEDQQRYRRLEERLSEIVHRKRSARVLESRGDEAIGRLIESFDRFQSRIKERLDAMEKKMDIMRSDIEEIKADQHRIWEILEKRYRKGNYGDSEEMTESSHAGSHEYL
jgi:hypothetical protein